LFLVVAVEAVEVTLLLLAQLELVAEVAEEVFVQSNSSPLMA
jgi:hypothetical protein